MPAEITIGILFGGKTESISLIHRERPFISLTKRSLRLLPERSLRNFLAKGIYIMTWKRTIAFVLSTVFLFSCAFSTAAAVEETNEETVNLLALNGSTQSETADETLSAVDVDDVDNYADVGNNVDEKYKGYEGDKYTNYLTFLNYFSDSETIGDKTVVDIKNSIGASEKSEVKEISDDDGVSKEAVVIEENGYVDMLVTVEKAGLYHVALDYLPIKGKPIDLEIALTIDGAVQYKEVNSLTLNRIWADDKTKDEKGNWPMQDLNGNETSPEAVEVFKWQNYTIHDNSFTSDSDLLFYLCEGEHSIKIHALRESIAIASVTFGGDEKIASYKDVYSEYESKGYKPVEKENVTVHAEYPLLKSQQSLIMGAEYTASTTNGTGDNLHYAKTRFNVFGGENWKTPNDWVDYEVEVEKSGLYTLSFKYKQDYVAGMNVYRKVYIDGEVPFEEFNAVAFAPTSVWTNYTVADKDGNPYYVYLEKGKHSIRLNVTLGPISETLQILEAQTNALNNWYMKIVQITGPSPDTLRDFDLDKTITGLIDGFKDIKKNLQICADTMEEINGDAGGAVSFVKVLIKQLDGFIKDPPTIAASLNGYKSNIAELSDTIVGMKDQSLLLDSIYVGDKDELPAPKMNFTGAIEFAAKGFVASFADNYGGYGDVKVDEEEGYVCEPITIWMSGGRDQYNIMTNLIADKFVPTYKIPVTLMLGDTGALTKAILAGIAPDIALGIPSDTPVNYAMRGALVDITRFNDENAVYDTTFEEAYEWFHKSAFISMRYQDGGVYGLPTDQNFSVMYVRSDILDDYGIKVPETWEEMYSILGLLQRNNMQIGLTGGDQGMLGTLVFQRGGEWYVEDKTKTAFDSDVFVDAFIEWTEFNTKWGIPVSFDALNRFRTGEMPIIFGAYTFVNTLQVSTPELQGLWDMYLLPGTARTDENGNEYIDHTQQTTGTCCIMVDAGENADYAWQFMTWFAGADAQADYNMKVETALTTGARGAPANLEAFERLPWTYDQSQVIKEQWEWLYDQPRVPGDYYIARQLSHAYRSVVYDGRNPREALLSYNQDANIEIQRKRIEYNVDRFWDEDYVHTDFDGKEFETIVDNETYERPSNYFGIISK